MPIISAVRRYVAGTVTPIAPVAALPTTAAQFALWNGEPVGGKTYTITAISATTIASAGAVIVMQPLAHISTAQQAAPTGTAVTGPRSTDGLTVASNAITLSAVTLPASTLAGGMWHPCGPAINGTANTATIALGTWNNVRGLYLLPPGAVLSLAMLCSAAGSATCDFFVQWEEA